MAQSSVKSFRRPVPRNSAGREALSAFANFAGGVGSGFLQGKADERTAEKEAVKTAKAEQQKNFRALAPAFINKGFGIEQVPSGGNFSNGNQSFNVTPPAPFDPENLQPKSIADVAAINKINNPLSPSTLLGAAQDSFDLDTSTPSGNFDNLSPSLQAFETKRRADQLQKAFSPTIGTMTQEQTVGAIDVVRSEVQSKGSGVLKTLRTDLEEKGFSQEDIDLLFRRAGFTVKRDGKGNLQ